MKRIVSVLTVIVMLICGVFVCGCDNKAEKEYIGIISAMENEIQKLLSETNVSRVDTVGSEKYYVGTLCGKNVVITKAGIGKVHASSGATTLFNTYKISKLLFTGIAGGVADQTQVLDEVIATNVVEHDYGIITNDGFVWCSGDPGTGGEEGVYYPCDEALIELAYETAKEVLAGEHNVFKGTIATGDQFIASESYVERLQQDYNAYACEMEGAAVAAICIKYEIPFVVIRALSDKADGNAHDSYEGFGNIAAENSSKIVIKMLESM
ncbi:MAG: 5'-methylthioadenosine/adenosylhomocysteine nucleosidase [Clostridia bacterium]|nr:5'-methylthioadenosine/adenosylhomocysteine nucleosidase [Clostridia bacterium]